MRFQKVSLEQWRKDATPCYLDGKQYEDLDELNKVRIDALYECIKLPKRGTNQSAGYDFYAPYNLEITKSPKLIPTGIRWISDPQQVLLLMPRSGQGFKYGLKLVNTMGVIDADYMYANNEGHIMAKLQSDKSFSISSGVGMMQGIVTTFITTDDDEVDFVRSGGFGSTGA